MTSSYRQTVYVGTTQPLAPANSYRQTVYVGTTYPLAPANCLFSFAVASRQNTHLRFS